jgi:molybdenum cofactor synthesis domain-containing protein
MARGEGSPVQRGVQAMTTAAALVIGNEILSGKVEEENLSYLAKELWSLGVSLQEVRILRDQVEAIVPAVRELSGQHSYLFTTGGIGPTHDDVTIEAVAQAFRVSLVRHPTLERLIRSSDPSREPTDSQLRMALVPEGSDLVGACDQSPWPTVRKENVYLFPGIPPYFRQRLDALREQLRTTPFVHLVLHTTLGEGALAESLTEIVTRYPRVEVGSYPVVDRADYRVRVSFEGRDRAEVEAARDALRAILPANVLVDP